MSSSQNLMALFAFYENLSRYFEELKPEVPIQDFKKALPQSLRCHPKKAR
jgi:hypothetical protein